MFKAIYNKKGKKVTSDVKNRFNINQATSSRPLFG
jgi:hypothetical protein